MKIGVNFTTLIIGILFVIGCANEPQPVYNHEYNQDFGQIYESYLITETGVLGLVIGEEMPSNITGFKLTKTYKPDDEGGQYAVMNVLKGDTEILEIVLVYDYQNEEETNLIRAILVKDSEFKTSKQLGVGATLSSIIKMCHSYEIYYSYIDGCFKVSCEESNILFILDGEGYIGRKDLFVRDRIELQAEEFSPETKVDMVYVYSIIN